MASRILRVSSGVHGLQLQAPNFILSSTSRVRYCFPLAQAPQTATRSGSLRNRYIEERAFAGRRSFRQAVPKSRATRGETSGNSPEEEEKNGQYEDPEGSEENNSSEEDEDDRNAEEISGQQNRKEKRGFWRRWWGRFRNEIVEVEEEEAENMEGDGEESMEGDEESGLAEEDNRREEESKPGFWARFWKPAGGSPESGASNAEKEISGEEEQLLRDIENLQLRWKDLLEPSVENVLALALTALLALAGVQILWQMVVVATAITLSGLKYTVLAAVIAGLLIFLL